MRRRTTHKLSWYISWSIILAAVLAAAGSFILSLPMWKLSKYEMRGRELISEKKLAAVAAIPFGDNVIFTDTGPVEKRIKGLVQVKTARVFKKLPDGIVIDIEERKPIAMVAIGKKTVFVDSDGYIIATPGETAYYVVPDMGRYPAVRGVKKADLVNGRRLNFRDRTFIARSLKLLSRFIAPESLQIEMGNMDNIVVFVEDVLRLELGDESNIERKIEVFGAILKEIEGKWDRVEYISVKAPDLPVVRYKK